jgi:uncharacterized membrane protein
VLSLGLVQKEGCAKGWSGDEAYTKYCYTDVLALYYSEELNTGAVPYLNHPVEYPVVTGYLMGLIGLPVHRLGQAHKLPWNEDRTFFYLNALVLGGCALVSVWAIARMRRRRPFDAAMMAAAPIVIFTGFVNWDLLPIALSTLGIYAWSRRRPGWAGVFLGLGVAAKLYPLFFFWPLLLISARARKWREFGITLATAVGTWVAVNAPVYYAAPKAWATFFTFSKERGLDWGTLWYVGSNAKFPFVGKVKFFADVAASPDKMNTWSLLIFGVLCVAIGALAIFAPRRPRLGQLVFLTIAAFLLPNKVWSQQFVLWLVPLAVLARPRWQAFLAWQACELFYFFTYYPNLIRASGHTTLVPDWLFLAAGGARAMGLIVLCVFVVGEILHPETDVVRAAGDDDPEGGVVNDVSDAPSVPGPREAALSA